MNLITNTPKHFYVISGDDLLALPTVLAGGSGVISVIANVFPNQIKKMVDLGFKSDVSQSYKIHYQLMKIINLIFEEGNPSGIKYLLSKKNLSNNTAKEFKDYIKFINGMKELLFDLPNLNKRKAIKLLTGNKEYLGNEDPDKSAFGVLLKLLASLAKNEIDLLISNKSVKEEISLSAAHLYAQISLLRHQSIEYNVEAKKVLFLALNIIESAFEKYKK